MAEPRKGFGSHVKSSIKSLFRGSSSLNEDNTDPQVAAGSANSAARTFEPAPGGPLKIRTASDSKSASWPLRTAEDPPSVPTSAGGSDALDETGGDELHAAEARADESGQHAGANYMELTSLSSRPDSGAAAWLASGSDPLKASFSSTVSGFDDAADAAQAEMDDNLLRNVYGVIDDEDPMMPKYCQSSSLEQQLGNPTSSFGSNASRARGPTASFGSSYGGNVGPTASFGSTQTDFDNLTSLGAQAEHNECYLAQAAQGAPAFLKMADTNGDGIEDEDYDSAIQSYAAAAAAGGVCIPPHAQWGGGYYPQWGGYYPQYPEMAHGDPALQLNAQACTLEMQAAQFREAARQAEEAAKRKRNQMNQALGIGPARGKTSAKAGPFGSGASKSAPSQALGDSGVQHTTVMLRNLPNDYTRDMLLELMDEHGFLGRYDFVYLPMDFKRWAGLGYAFANMVSHEAAMEMIERLNGFTNWKKMSAKVCEVTWGDQGQGLEAHIDRYRNSPVMHAEMPDEAKPVLYQDGVRIEFPPPTKKLRPPRVKR